MRLIIFLVNAFLNFLKYVRGKVIHNISFLAKSLLNFSNFFLNQELMKLMGRPNWMHWLCWFLDGTISAAVSVMVNKI
jgi:hypothetical protein